MILDSSGVLYSRKSLHKSDLLLEEEQDEDGNCKEGGQSTRLDGETNEFP
jgi:hypothetical protein